MSGLKKLVFTFSYRKSNPLDISYKLYNPNDVDLYVCDYFSAWDECGDCWNIKNENGEKAYYDGGKADREAEEDCPSSWMLVRSKGSIEGKGRFEYGLRNGNEHEVEYNKKSVEVSRENDGKKITNVERVELEIVGTGT